MNPLCNLTNTNHDCSVSSEQLLHELIQWACVTHYGGTKSLLEGIWLENSGMSEPDFNSVPLRHSNTRFIRKRKGPPNVFLLSFPEL